MTRAFLAPAIQSLVLRGAGRTTPECVSTLAQSHASAPPLWESMTQVSKTSSFFRSIASYIHGNGFPALGKDRTPVQADRNGGFAMKCMYCSHNAAFNRGRRVGTAQYPGRRLLPVPRPRAASLRIYS